MAKPTKQSFITRITTQLPANLEKILGDDTIIAPVDRGQALTWQSSPCTSYSVKVIYDKSAEKQLTEYLQTQSISSRIVHPGATMDAYEFNATGQQLLALAVQPYVSRIINAKPNRRY